MRNTYVPIDVAEIFPRSPGGVKGYPFAARDRAACSTIRVAERRTRQGEGNGRGNAESVHALSRGADKPCDERGFSLLRSDGAYTPRAITAADVEAYAGVSCWSRFQDAEKVARKTKRVWIAELRVSDPPMRVVQLVGGPYHFTVFAQALMLRAIIVRYHRVDR